MPRRALANLPWPWHAQVANWQIISEGGGVLENRVEPLPGVAVRALAACEPDSDDRTGVEITEVVVEVGPLRCVPLPRLPRPLCCALLCCDVLCVCARARAVCVSFMGDPRAG